MSSADTGWPEPVRLGVVAALVGSAARAGSGAPAGQPVAASSEGTAGSGRPVHLAAESGGATADERRLAEALCGGPGADPNPDAPKLADLLQLAHGTPTADTFVVGLRQAFLIPDDSWHALAREERTAAFADIYRRLALPGLSGESGTRAQAILLSVTSA